MGYIHAACLTAWVQEQGCLSCELCKQQYEEQHVQALGLAAAADKAKPKEGTGAAGGYAGHSGFLSSKRLRFSLW
jgi:hypothetical protein